MKAVVGLAVIAASATAIATPVKAADEAIKIGVLTDLSGVYAAPTGPGSVFAARQAVADFAAAHKGLKVEVVAGDHQNKPDIGAGIAHRWIDAEKVDAIVDVPTSSVAFVVNDIVKSKNRVFLASGAAASDLTGTRCTPNTVHWTYDTWALANGTGKAIATTGSDSWFFLTAVARRNVVGKKPAAARAPRAATRLPRRRVSNARRPMVTGMCPSPCEGCPVKTTIPRREQYGLYVRGGRSARASRHGDNVRIG